MPTTDGKGQTTHTFEVDVQLQVGEALVSYTVEIRMVSSSLNWIADLWVIVHPYLSPIASNPLCMRATDVSPDLEVGSYPVGVEQVATGHALQVYAQREALLHKE
jgi:hypothetical protein